jgi:hypothetical protein
MKTNLAVLDDDFPAATAADIKAMGLPANIEAWANAVVSKAVGGKLPTDTERVLTLYYHFDEEFQTTFSPLLGPDLQGMLSLERLFVQRNPKFVEGSLPYGVDADGSRNPRARLLDAVLKVMFGLATNANYRGDMTGAIRSGGGILPILMDGDEPRIMLGEDGEKFHAGKIKILGGQLDDNDRGDEWACALREVTKEEVGDFHFRRERAWLLHRPLGWRDTDGRMEYPISGSFFIYPVNRSEVADIHAIFKAKMVAAKQDPEIVQLHSYTAAELAGLIRDKRIIFPEQCEAYVLLCLVMTLLPKAQFMAKRGLDLTRPGNRFQAWSMAREAVMPRFRGLMTSMQGDYTKLPMDFMDGVDNDL